SYAALRCIPHRMLRFLYHDPPSTEIYTLSLHDALPIWVPDPGADRARLSRQLLRDGRGAGPGRDGLFADCRFQVPERHALSPAEDRKSTRLNSSHVKISYAVFCLKKKNKTNEK